MNSNNEETSSALIAHRKVLIELAKSGVFHRYDGSFSGRVNIFHVRGLIVSIARNIVKSRLHYAFDQKLAEFRAKSGESYRKMESDILFSILSKSVAELRDRPECFGQLLDALFQSGEFALAEAKSQNQLRRSQAPTVGESSSSTSSSIHQNNNWLATEELNNYREELVFFVLNIFRIELTHSLYSANINNDRSKNK